MSVNTWRYVYMVYISIFLYQNIPGYLFAGRNLIYLKIDFKNGKRR
ncbi:MAG TPA: hypothetical protein VFO70_03530 [Chitinophagaceae bacterium]|nr:hypothetical protein [Chitinophagaceae bacterium]